MKPYMLKRIATALFILLALLIINSGQSQVIEGTEGQASNTQLSYNEKNVFNKTTHVDILKVVDGRAGHPEFEYTINIPKVDDFEFILALDSSGSFLDGGQANAVKGAVPKFIKSILELHRDKNFNLSIMSWDEDIDFVYPAKGLRNPFKNNKTELVKFSNVTQVDKDLDRYQVFSADNSEYYYTKEEEFTDLNQPLKASLDIFNRIPVNEFNRTSRFIILVTGRGEFWPAVSDLINRTQEKKFSIYVIGLDLFGYDNNLTRNLKKLSDNDPRKYQVLQNSATPDNLEKDLLDALGVALDNAIKEPVVKDLTIVEPFYEYVFPNEDKISIIERVKDSLGPKEIYPNYRFYNTSENDNMTKKVVIELLDELMPNSETTIRYSANLNMKSFPLVFSKASIEFFNKMASIEGQQNSHISYTWLKKLPVNDSLPDLPIDIEISS
jgi:hypothetical protein